MGERLETLKPEMGAEVGTLEHGAACGLCEVDVLGVLWGGWEGLRGTGQSLKMRDCLAPGLQRAPAGRP